MTYITWYERPARIGSEAGLIGIRLHEDNDFTPTLKKLTERYGDRLEKNSFGGVTYWEVKYNDLAEVPPEGAPDVTDRDRRRAAYDAARTLLCDNGRLFDCD